jgi:hypothetical protein
MKSRHCAFSIIGILAAGSLSISSAARAQGSPDNACGYITDAQVGTAIGTPVAPGQQKRGSTAGMTQCNWRSTNQEITVGFQPVTAQYFQRTKNSDMRMAAKPVNGIGDEAHFRESTVQMGNFYVLLYVQKGSTMFEVSVGGIGVPAAQLRQMEAAVAKAAIANGL